MADALPDILVNGGLVETRDATLFSPGDMIRATDAYYKPNDPALWSVLGNAAFNSIAIDPIIGLRYLEYDGAPDVILAHVGDEILEAPAGLTGEFTSKITGLTATGVKGFDSCHYNNKYILFDGVNRNRVRESDGTYRFHGMLAAVNPPVVNPVSGAGGGFSLGANVPLTYWIEEQVRDVATGRVLRRNATSSITQTATITGTGITIKPRITRPAILNPDATHWAVYVTSTTSIFPLGASIGSAPVATTFIDDMRSSFVLPTLQVIPPGTWSPIATLINLANQQALAAAALQPLTAGLATGDIYETVAVTLDNLTAITAKNGPPPISSSMDVMEDSIVMNDMTNRSLVWFAYPDQPDVVPYTNFIRFETKDGDEVQWVKFLGRGTVVALKNSLWRIDTLPQPSDAAFQIARVKAQIDGAFGGAGAKSVCTFNFGGRSLLAYSSRAGICITDGETWGLLSADIDWEARVDLSQLEFAVLEDNPQQFRLEFTYTPVGGDHNSATFFFHYHPSHAKGEMTKVTGPINRGGNAKTLVAVSGSRLIFAGQSNGKVYVEWTGLVNLLGDIAFDVLTGDKYPFGVGKRARNPRTWVHHQAGGATQRATFYTVQRTEGLDDAEDSDTFPLKRREPTSVPLDCEGEAFQFGVRATNPTAQIVVDFFIPEFEDGGEASADGEA